MNNKTGNTHQESDFGTAETQKQGGGVNKGYTADGGKVARVNYQNHFDELLHRGVIDEKQHRAGEYLRNDADRAKQFAYIKSSSDYDVRGNMTEYAAEAIAEAKKRYADTLSILDNHRVNGFSEREVVEKIVIDDGYLTNFTKNANKLRKIRAHLHGGLNKLVLFYRV